jgi:hypothetical protein
MERRAPSPAERRKYREARRIIEKLKPGIQAGSFSEDPEPTVKAAITVKKQRNEGGGRPRPPNAESIEKPEELSRN